MLPKFLYIFLDESGNLDFSANGTRFFVFTGVVQERPFDGPEAKSIDSFNLPLTALKDVLNRQGIET
jgi:hypothetical protein